MWHIDVNKSLILKWAHHEGKIEETGNFFFQTTTNKHMINRLIETSRNIWKDILNQ